MSLLGDLGTAIKNKLGGTSVDNTVPRYNGTTCTMQGSGVTISDTNVVTASGGFVGNLTGNASTATKFQTARLINGVSFDGTADITIPSIPTGGIIMWSGSIVSIPTGWALCNGQNGTPNLIDRFVVMAGNTYNVGSTGGSKDAIVVSHTHTQAAHNHTATTDSAGEHTHSTPVNNGGYFQYSGGGGNPGVVIPIAGGTTSSAGVHTHTLTTNTVTPTINSTGSDGTNANLPPYYALAYIMKL